MAPEINLVDADTYQRGGAPHGRVLAVGMRLVSARDLMTGPAPPGLRLDQGGSPRMKWSGFQHLRDKKLASPAPIGKQVLLGAHEGCSQEARSRWANMNSPVRAEDWIASRSRGPHVPSCLH